MYEKYADEISDLNVFPDGKLFRLVFDCQMNSLRLISKTRDLLEEIRQSFSIENKSAFFSQQYGYKGIPRLYNINSFGYFYSGLVYAILEWIKLTYGSLQQVAISKKCAAYISEILQPLNGLTENLELENVSEQLGKNAELKAAGKTPFEFRPYQIEAVRSLIAKGKGRGLIEIPTAGGKSFILANFIWNVSKLLKQKTKTLILVPNVQLVEQFYKDLLDYGYSKSDLAKFEGGMTKKEKKENDVANARIVIANRQYVFKNKKLLPDFDILICDECHSCNAESSAELITSCNAKIKVGCSGTIPTDKYLRNQLIGMFGQIVYHENITDLQKSGYISKLKIISFQIHDKTVESDRSLLFNVNSTKKYDADNFDSDIKFDDAVKAEREYISRWYKELYKPVLDYITNFDGNTLVLFDKIEIGRSLYEYFVELHPEKPSFYNDGSTDVKEREETRSNFEHSGDNVLFANVQILSTGVNIKRLHNIVFAFGSKSTVRVVQSVGRALRLYSDKDYARLIDVSMNFKYSQRHYRERLKMYKDLYMKNKPDETVKVYI